VFTLASIGAGLAHNGTEMIIVRAIQGVVAPSVTRHADDHRHDFPGTASSKAIVRGVRFAGAGGAAGALLGGILTGLVSWRWIFFINVPIGVVAGVAASLYFAKCATKMRPPSSTSPAPSL